MTLSIQQPVTLSSHKSSTRQHREASIMVTEPGSIKGSPVKGHRLAQPTLAAPPSRHTMSKALTVIIQMTEQLRHQRTHGLCVEGKWYGYPLQMTGMPRESSEGPSQELTVGIMHTSRPHALPGHSEVHRNDIQVIAADLETKPCRVMTDRGNMG